MSEQKESSVEVLTKNQRKQLELEADRQKSQPALDVPNTSAKSEGSDYSKPDMANSPIFYDDSKLNDMRCKILGNILSWGIKYDGTTDVFDFIEAVEDRQRARGIPDQVMLGSVNEILMFTGAMAVAAIRLCWDPTLYMPLRALCPRELAALIALLGAGAACLTLLSHLPDISRPRALLAVYFYVGGIAILCEVAGAVWVCERVWRWYRQEGNEMIQRAGRLAEHTLRLLQEAENWWPAAGAARALLHEIRIVLPQYAWMVAGCVVLYACVRLCALFVAALLLYSPRFPRLKYKKVHIDTVPA